MENIFKREIISFYPKYEKGVGDITFILLKEEDIVVKKAFTTFLTGILNYYMINLKEIKNMYKDLIRSKNLIPIPFDEENIFIPFKARIPKCRKDKAFGYLNIKYIDSFKEEGKNTYINLTNGKKIKAYMRKNTFLNHWQRGNIMKACYIERKMAKDLESVYYPASKIDLALLLKLLLTEKKKI